MDPVTCFSSALQSRTDLPSPSQEARALSVAMDMPLSQVRGCKTLFIQIFTNCYWWSWQTCFKFCRAWHLFTSLFMWLPQSVAGVTEFREVIEREAIWGIHRRRNWEGRAQFFSVFFFFTWFFWILCSMLWKKKLAICLTDISKVETVLKIKFQVVLCRKLIKRRKWKTAHYF